MGDYVPFDLKYFIYTGGVSGLNNFINNPPVNLDGFVDEEFRSRVLRDCPGHGFYGDFDF